MFCYNVIANKGLHMGIVGSQIAAAVDWVIKGTVTGANSLFPENNVITRLFFKSTELAKEYRKKPVISVLGLTSVVAGTFLANTPGAILGLLTTATVATLWNRLEDPILEQKITEQIFEQQGEIDLEAGTAEHIKISKKIEKLKDLILDKDSVDSVKKLALQELLKLILPNLGLNPTVLEEISLALTTITQSKHLKDTLKQEAIEGLKSLLEGDTVFPDTGENIIGNLRDLHRRSQPRIGQEARSVLIEDITARPPSEDAAAKFLREELILAAKELV